MILLTNAARVCSVHISIGAVARILSFVVVLLTRTDEISTSKLRGKIEDRLELKGRPTNDGSVYQGHEQKKCTWEQKH